MRKRRNDNRATSTLSSSQAGGTSKNSESGMKRRMKKK